MAHKELTPEAALLEETITILFCQQIDDAYRILNPNGYLDALRQRPFTVLVHRSYLPPKTVRATVVNGKSLFIATRYPYPVSSPPRTTPATYLLHRNPGVTEPVRGLPPVLHSHRPRFPSSLTV